MLEQLGTCPTIRPTRVSQDICWGDNNGCIPRQPDPFRDFDLCEMKSERERALKDVEQHGVGPKDEEEARWPESRILSLLSFSNEHTVLEKCEQLFAERLLAWYIAGAQNQIVAVRAINFGLNFLKPLGFRYATQDKQLTEAIGKAVRKCPGCYKEVIGLSEFLGKMFSELLKQWHEKDVWEMVADILETVCVAEDYVFINNIEPIRKLYATRKTGRHSGRRCDRVDEQPLWTAAEIGYIEQAHQFLAASAAHAQAAERQKVAAIEKSI
jgi:hypothetical protein